MEYCEANGKIIEKALKMTNKLSNNEQQHREEFSKLHFEIAKNWTQFDGTIYPSITPEEAYLEAKRSSEAEIEELETKIQLMFMERMPVELYNESEEKLKLTVSVVKWAQCILTGLNVGNVAQDRALHLKLRQVMIEHRENVENLKLNKVKPKDNKEALESLEWIKRRAYCDPAFDLQSDLNELEEKLIIIRKAIGE
jgi:hypothetical protein